MISIARFKLLLTEFLSPAAPAPAAPPAFAAFGEAGPPEDATSALLAAGFYAFISSPFCASR